jgi:hypothetical protein
MHCPFCKSCISKHSAHSVVFGLCIGAANELFALLYFLSFWVTEALVLWMFFKLGTYGLVTKVMFYLMNGTFCWMAFTEFAKLAVFVRLYLCRIFITASLRLSSRRGTFSNTC